MVAADRYPVHVLWLTSGLGCDGDSVAMTAARNPSFEDLIRGCFPGAPPVVIYNPLLAYETGDEFMRPWFEAAAGKLEPFILVLEGSVPNEEISGEGYWATMGVDPATGDPISTCTWIDRLAPRAAAVLALGTCATFGGIPAMRNNPTGAMGLRDYLGWSLELTSRRSDRQPPRLSGAARQHHRDPAAPRAARRPGAGADGRRRRARPPALAVRANGAAGLRTRRLRRAWASSRRRRPTTAGAWSSSAARARSTKCNVPLRGWVGGIGGCPNVGGICNACTMPGFPDKFMPFMDATRLGLLYVERGAVDLRAGDPAAAQPRDPAPVRPRAGLARAGQELTSGYEPRW